MRSKLAITAPGFSLELGTPERKMLDAVAEAVSECYIDQYLVGSLLDVAATSCAAPTSSTSVTCPTGRS